MIKEIIEAISEFFALFPFGDYIAMLLSIFILTPIAVSFPFLIMRLIRYISERT